MCKAHVWFPEGAGIESQPRHRVHYSQSPRENSEIGPRLGNDRFLPKFSSSSVIRRYIGLMPKASLNNSRTTTVKDILVVACVEELLCHLSKDLSHDNCYNGSWMWEPIRHLSYATQLSDSYCVLRVLL
jgi:hypothetical protein